MLLNGPWKIMCDFLLFLPIFRVMMFHTAGQGTCHPAITSSISTQRKTRWTYAEENMENPATFSGTSFFQKTSSVSIYATFLSPSGYLCCETNTVKIVQRTLTRPEICLRIQGNGLRTKDFLWFLTSKNMAI